MNQPADETKKGAIYATLCYLCWGFFPIYWKLLKHVPFLQVLSYRMISAFTFYSCIQIYKERKAVLFIPEGARKKAGLVMASLLLMVNWLVYIYAVNTNQVIEGSLGYFINPLVNIVIGIFFFKERLTRYQVVAALLAAVGVLIISLDQGKIPWIALTLAFTFSFYGVIKKLNPVSGVKSNQFEAMVMAIPAAIFLLTQEAAWATPENTWWTVMLLVGAGVVTGLPLIFFAEAAQKIPYYLMGFFQFLAPTFQFISGYFLFHEPLSALKLKGFFFIWLAGMILILSGWWTRRKKLLAK